MKNFGEQAVATSAANRSLSLLGKLVRDKIPELIAEEGRSPEVEVLNSAQYSQELNKKLLEEAKEVIEATDKTSKTEEIADLLEVIQAIAQDSSISLTEIENIRIKKKEQRGGFEKRILLKSAK